MRSKRIAKSPETRKEKKLKEKRCNMGFWHPVIHKYVREFWATHDRHGTNWHYGCKECGQPEDRNFHV